MSKYDLKVTMKNLFFIILSTFALIAIVAREEFISKYLIEVGPSPFQNGYFSPKSTPGGLDKHFRNSYFVANDYRKLLLLYEYAQEYDLFAEASKIYWEISLQTENEQRVKFTQADVIEKIWRKLKVSIKRTEGIVVITLDVSDKFNAKQLLHIFSMVVVEKTEEEFYSQFHDDLNSTKIKHSLKYQNQLCRAGEERYPHKMLYPNLCRAHWLNGSKKFLEPMYKYHAMSQARLYLSDVKFIFEARDGSTIAAVQRFSPSMLIKEYEAARVGF